MSIELPPSFCGLAALALMGRARLCDTDRLLRWAANRQMRQEGGFQVGSGGHFLHGDQKQTSIGYSDTNGKSHGPLSVSRYLAMQGDSGGLGVRLG